MLKLTLASVNKINLLSPLDQEVNMTPWSKDNYLTTFKAKDNFIYLLELDSRIVSCLVVRLNLSEIEVLQFWTSKLYQGLGYASYLFNNVLKLLKGFTHINAAYLEVRRDNFSAINLYKKLGFIQVGCRKNYYATLGIDALVMYLALD